MAQAIPITLMVKGTATSPYMGRLRPRAGIWDGRGITRITKAARTIKPTKRIRELRSTEGAKINELVKSNGGTRDLRNTAASALKASAINQDIRKHRTSIPTTNG